MPTIKRDVRGAESRQPVGVYEGSPPPDATYRARVTSVRLRTWKNAGTQYLNFAAVLDAKNKDGENAEFDGYTAWAPVTIDSGNEVGESREKSAYEAIAGKADVAIQVDDKAQGDPVVTKIGGVNPVGKYVFVQLQTQRSEEFGNQQRGNWIYPDPSSNGGQTVEAEASTAEPEGEPEAEKPKRTRKTAAKKGATVTSIRKEAEPEAEAEIDYGALTLPKLREAAAKAGIDHDGVSRKDLVAQLEAKTKSGGDDGDKKYNPQDITDMDEDELQELLEGENGWYEEGDTEGMSRPEIVEMLVQDNFISPF